MLGIMMHSPHRRQLAMVFAAVLALGVGIALLTGAIG